MRAAAVMVTMARLPRIAVSGMLTCGFLPPQGKRLRPLNPHIDAGKTPVRHGSALVPWPLKAGREPVRGAVTVVWGRPGTPQRDIRATVAALPFKPDRRRTDVTRL